MNKFLILLLSFVSVIRTEFFDIGNQSFASQKPPMDKTRAQWYEESLKNSEKQLRDDIIAALKISPQDYQKVKLQAEKTVAEIEQEIKKKAQNIIGIWVKNNSTRSIYRADKSLWQKIKHRFQDYEIFEITDQDIARVKKIAKNFGYAGEIVTLNPEHIREAKFSGLDTPMESVAAYKSVITIRPNFFLYSDIDQIFLLRHEISHIQNGDILFEQTIKNYVQSFVHKDFSGWDLQALKDKGLTLDDTDKASALLHDVWWDFHERRADMQALLALKKNKEFQEKIKEVPEYDGYPLHLNILYQEMSNVRFIDDFIQGLRNDAANLGL